MPPSSSPPSVPDDAVLASWLTEEPTKLLLARVGEHVSAWRTALVVLVSACAYVGVAALGHVQGEQERERKVGLAEVAYDEQDHSLGAAREAERTAFQRYEDARLAVGQQESAVAVGTKDVSISERRQDLAEQAQQAAQKEREARQREVQAGLSYREQQLAAARAAVHAAQERIEAFQRKDEASRLEWDRRRASVPPDLTQALERAQAEERRQQQALNQARPAAHQASPAPASSVAAGAQPAEPAPLALEMQLRVVLENLASARLRQAEAENDWQLAQRELRDAEARQAAAQAERGRLEREPPPLQLPVLSVAVSPRLFFASAPLLLVLLYLHVVLQERGLATARAALLARAAARGVGSELLLPCVGALQGGRARFWAAHLLLGLVLVALLLLDPSQIATWVVAAVAVLGWSAWGAATVVARRRARS